MASFPDNFAYLLNEWPLATYTEKVFPLNPSKINQSSRVYLSGMRDLALSGDTVFYGTL